MSTAPEVLCAGIVVADHVCTPISHLPAAGELVTAEQMLLTIGGCAANVAVDLIKMKVQAAVVGRVGDDVFGRVVADMLREHGVNVDALRSTAGAATSQTMIVNVQGEDRRFVHTFGANAEFSATDIAPDAVARCRVLYLGGYLVMPRIEPNALARVFAEAQQAGVRTVLDVVTPGPGDYLPRLKPILPHVDVFLPNTDEARVISGEVEPVRQAEFFRGHGVRTALITLGHEGAVLVGDGVRLLAGIYSMPYVDGSGGGDAFAAGYIYGLLHELPVEECLRVASALGASCVRALGTTPGVFTQSECDAFVREQALRIEKL